MLGRLLPRERSFFDLFEQHAELMVQGANEFLDMVSSSAASFPARAKRIKELEHETDVITHRCVEALHRTFITPLDRDDIHRLITRMDDIMDYVEAAADRIALYELREMTPEVRQLADLVVRATKEIRGAVGGLRDLKRAELIKSHCVDINKLENEADAVLRAAVAKLFREQKDPLEVLKWKEIYENLEEATDRCEDVANIIEGVVIEQS